MPSLAAVTRPRVLEWPMLESRGVQAVRVAVRLEGTPIRGNQVGHGMPAKPVAVKPEFAIERVLDPSRQYTNSAHRNAPSHSPRNTGPSTDTRLGLPLLPVRAPTPSR